MRVVWGTSTPASGWRLNAIAEEGGLRNQAYRYQPSGDSGRSHTEAHSYRLGFVLFASYMLGRKTPARPDGCVVAKNSVVGDAPVYKNGLPMKKAAFVTKPTEANQVKSYNGAGS